MRITGGRLKGIRPGNKFAAHVRPTTDFVRESLFNKLQHTSEIEHAGVLDLFAGSGIMALEFISRGAASVVSIDRDVMNIRHMKTESTRLKTENWQIAKADVFAFLRQTEQQFDFIFADPPYDLPGINELPELCMPRLNPQGLLIIEHKPGLHFSTHPAETKHYGSTVLSIFAAD